LASQPPRRGERTPWIVRDAAPMMATFTIPHQPGWRKRDTIRQCCIDGLGIR
jgi:hypothetical protein